MIDVQEQVLSPSSGVRRPIHLTRQQPLVLRNNRVLIFFTYLGSILAFCLSGCMGIVTLTCIFPLHALTLERFAAAALWGFGAWLMAMSQVFLWRQGSLMTRSSVTLEVRGARFKLDNSTGNEEVFMPWSEIEAVHYKRIENAQKFTILGKDSTTVTFTSLSFYRPKHVARIIAQHAGLPLVHG